MLVNMEVISLTLSLNDPILKRQIIMDHYENPRNKSLVNDPRYLKVNMNSESCIDDIDLQILVEDNIIKDFRFDGVGCTISTASTSILSEAVVFKDVSKQANRIKCATIGYHGLKELLMQLRGENHE